MPTDATLEYRMSIGDVPRDRKYEVYIATESCAYIGKEGTLHTHAGDFRVIVFDCAGDDGGNTWMQANNIVVEVDWYTWQTYPTMVGSYASLVLYD